MRSPKVMRAGMGNKNFFIWPNCDLNYPTCIEAKTSNSFTIGNLTEKVESFIRLKFPKLLTVGSICSL